MKSLIRDERGLLSIEAALVFVVFFLGYIFINSLVLSTYTESNTKKALNSMALDISNYSLILEKAGLTAYFEKGHSTSILEDLSKIAKDEISKEKFDKDSIINEIKTLLFNKITNAAKTQAYNQVFRKVIRRYFKNENYLEEKGIIGDYEGLDFSKSRLLDQGQFEIIMKYKIKTMGPDLFSQTRNIVQSAYITSNIENTKLSLSQAKEGEKRSIWKESNFTRGRFFADYIRESSTALTLKKGQGLDLYSPSANKLSQFHSINIFTKSYSDFNNDQYKLKIDFIEKELLGKTKDFNDSLAKLAGTIKLADEQILKLPQTINKELIIVMPNEAKNYPEIANLSKKQINGISIKIVYLENAL